ncbi:hypothetical protein LIER_16156 [Lithospermum erythrorhizon]|uniref:Uncharacterized protein n=1 Tax=Lithospermum erythrorhizon TaxID=34254 RepID=A0AAV3QA71_LITER
MTTRRINQVAILNDAFTVPAKRLETGLQSLATNRNTTKKASEDGRRCQGKDPTNQHKPNTTHVPTCTNQTLNGGPRKSRLVRKLNKSRRAPRPMRPVQQTGRDRVFPSSRVSRESRYGRGGLGDHVSPSTRVPRESRESRDG